MNQYYHAGSGLKKMFIAQVGAVACTMLAAVPVINLAGGIGAIVFAIVSMVGLYGAGKEIEGCRIAFILTMVNIVLSIFSGLFGTSAAVSAIFSTIDGILSFLVVYYVCTSVAEVMKYVGAGDVADRGTLVWKVSLGCYLAIVLISVCAVLPALNVVAIFGAVIVAVVSIAAAILFMIFLYRSYRALGA